MGCFVVDHILIDEQKKLGVTLDEINEFQSITGLKEKIEHNLAQKILDNPRAKGWLSEHSATGLMGRSSFCTVIIQSYKIYLTESPKSCTATEIKAARNSAISLKYSLPEILPPEASKPDFVDGLNAMTKYNPSILPTTASKRGKPRRRELVINIATKIYDTFNVLPTNKVVTSLVCVVTDISARSVRDTYTKELKQEIVATKGSRLKETSKNIITANRAATAIVDGMKQQLLPNKEKTDKKTDIDKVGDVIAILKEEQGNDSFNRQLSIVLAGLYELKQMQ